MGFIKYFRDTLMGHEIFFKIFDGPQNVFLCSIFVILFFKGVGPNFKLHSLRRYKANSDKDFKKTFDAFSL